MSLGTINPFIEIYLRFFGFPKDKIFSCNRPLVGFFYIVVQRLCIYYYIHPNKGLNGWKQIINFQSGICVGGGGLTSV